MHAAVEGKIHLSFIDTTPPRYSDAFAAELNKQSEELMQEYRSGKRTAYDSADEAFAALLKEADQL